MTPSEINKLSTEQALRVFKRNATRKTAKKGETVYVLSRGENYPVYILTVRPVYTSFIGYGRVLAFNAEKSANKIKQMLIDNCRFHTFKTDF